MHDQLQALGARLQAARLEEKVAWDRIDWKKRDRTEYRQACDRTLELERQIAALKGEQYAIPVEFPVAWDIGAPMPHLLVNDYKAFLLFYRRVDDPKWDGTTCRVVDPTSSDRASLVLVEFFRCYSAKLGSPNDEVFSGHPLEGRGAVGYTAQQVLNSLWIKEIKDINSVHPQFREEAYEDLKHYVFWFHDSIFECLAKSFTVELLNKSLPDLLQYAAMRLNARA